LKCVTGRNRRIDLNVADCHVAPTLAIIPSIRALAFRTCGSPISLTESAGGVGCTEGKQFLIGIYDLPLLRQS
jgi:hypothetical protein